LRAWAQELKAQLLTLWFARSHPDTPWYAKALAAGVVAYALSPVDLIPDFIPIIGYLDDLIIVPIGIAAVLRLIPAEILIECRAQAQVGGGKHVGWVGAAFMVAVWLVAATWLVLVVRALLT